VEQQYDDHDWEYREENIANPEVLFLFVSFPQENKESLRELARHLISRVVHTNSRRILWLSHVFTVMSSVVLNQFSQVSPFVPLFN
jgi:hypothetical protein